ncbi:hypothetical protein D3C80_1417580 [compost metagenome]
MTEILFAGRDGAKPARTTLVTDTRIQRGCVNIVTMLQPNLPGRCFTVLTINLGIIKKVSRLARHHVVSHAGLLAAVAMQYPAQLKGEVIALAPIAVITVDPGDGLVVIIAAGCQARHPVTKRNCVLPGIVMCALFAMRLE